MPDLYYGINQTGYSIMDQLVAQVAEGLFDRMDILRFVKGAMFITSPQRGISTVADANKNVFVTTDRVDGTVNYILDPKQVPWPVTNKSTLPGLYSSTKTNTEYPILWADESRGVFLREQTTPAALSYDLTLTFQTNDAAIRAFDQIQRMIIGDVVNFNFDISYSYPITTYIFMFFMNAWMLRDGYRNKNLLEYINDFAREKISWSFRKSQLDKDHPDMQLFMRRCQLFCQAKIQCDAAAPEAVRVNNAVDCYTIPLSFQIQFGRPFQLIGTMPVTIDNQFVNPKLFERVQITENKNIQATTTSNWQRAFYQKFFPGFHIDNAFMVIPPYDTANMTDTLMKAMYFNPFFQIAFTLDGDKTTIDLNDMCGVGLHPIVKEIILKERGDIFSFEGLFNIRVYADLLPISPELLSLSDDLKLTVGSCGMSRRYHLVISEATKVSYLNRQYYADLLEHRYFFPMTIVRNLDFMVKQGYFTISSGNQLVATVQQLMSTETIYAYIQEWIKDGETTEEIYQYCGNAAQLADYLSNTKSKNQSTQVSADLTHALPENVQAATTYLQTSVPSDNKSLYNTLIATSLADGTVTSDNIPTPYMIAGNGYPYTTKQESYYGFTSPFRIITTRFECQ